MSSPVFGSVTPKHDFSRPWMSGVSIRFFCSGVPNLTTGSRPKMFMCTDSFFVMNPMPPRLIKKLYVRQVSMTTSGPSSLPDVHYECEVILISRTGR